MSSELAYFREKDIHKIAPLLNNSQAWEAFLALMDYMQGKVLRQLNTRSDHETLIRLAAQFEQIQRLRDTRVWISEIEKGLKNVSS